MRIALLAPLISAIRQPQEGGAQTLVADLALELTRRGHDVDLVAASGSSLPGVNIVDTGVDPASLARALVHPGRSGSRRSPTVTAAFAAAYQRIREGGYDVVHNHAFDAAAIDLGASAGAPLLHTLHMPADDEVAEALNAARSRGGVTVAAVSATQAAAWATLTTVDAVVRNGIPVNDIEWSGEPGIGVLFAGRLSPEKGSLEAIEICQRAGIGLTLAGPVYDEAYAEQVRRRCFETADAELVGALSRADLWRRMAAASAVVVPSAWDEPFGLVAAEALATGTPVVGFRRGALPEIVVEGTGTLVDPGDIDAAAAALGAAGAVSRAACRAHAEQSLGLDAMVDGYQALYRG
jgi:glycosyltransferase involved in cell wall biosynthesis